MGEQLLEKVPSLKEETPELIKNSKDNATLYLADTTSFLASFPVALVMLKMLDVSLDIVESVIMKSGGSDQNFLPSYVKKIHIMANDLRLEGSKGQAQINPSRLRMHLSWAPSWK